MMRLIESQDRETGFLTKKMGKAAVWKRSVTKTTQPATCTYLYLSIAMARRQKSAAHFLYWRSVKMKSGTLKLEGDAATLTWVTVPMWFTVAAAKRVALAKGVASVAVFGATGTRATVPVLALAPEWNTKTLAKCIAMPPQHVAGGPTQVWPMTVAA